MTCCLAQDTFPVLLPPTTLRGENNGAEDLNQVKDESTVATDSFLDASVIPLLDAAVLCPCGGTGSWRRIAHLDMSDPNQQCPTNEWALATNPVRSCSRRSDSCSSALFPAGGAYSRVCGRVNGYQKGQTDAIEAAASEGVDVEGPYVDGVSLTHRSAGSRQHIWSFASAICEERKN